MKKTIILGILSFLLVIPVVSHGQRLPLRNQTGTTTATTTQDQRDRLETQRQLLEQKREEAEKRIQEHREQLEQKREEIKNQLEERRERFNELRKERIGAYFERMVRRIEAAFNRLGEFVERIESRITLLEENNENIQTTEAKNYLAEAKVKIAEGLASLGEAKITAEELITAGESDDPRTLFEKLRELVRESVTKLREAHEDIKNAVRSIKAVPNQDNNGSNATTTATSTSGT